MYAESKGWTVVTVYHLEGVSGKAVSWHPETKRMRADVESGAITGLIFSKLARLARSTKELLEFSEYFREPLSCATSIPTSPGRSPPPRLEGEDLGPQVPSHRRQRRGRGPDRPTEVPPRQRLQGRPCRATSGLAGSPRRPGPGPGRKPHWHLVRPHPRVRGPQPGRDLRPSPVCERRDPVSLSSALLEIPAGRGLERACSSSSILRFQPFADALACTLFSSLQDTRPRSRTGSEKARTPVAEERRRRKCQDGDFRSQDRGRNARTAAGIRVRAAVTPKKWLPKKDARSGS